LELAMQPKRPERSSPTAETVADPMRAPLVSVEPAVAVDSPRVATKAIPQPGATVAGKYVLESMLGQGGMGAVFRARHVLTDRKVALKWMLPDEQAGDAAVQRFLREARAMGRIEHPSVVGVLDVGVENDAAYLVMELLRGQSLRERIEAAGGKLSPEEAIGALLPAMEGVAAAHAAGVVHRDLKPDNLFCVAATQAGKPVTKVLDFGVSKLQGDRFAGPGVPGSGAITHTGAMVGTPAYMAPEQVRGARDLDPRTDVWALGAILYEAVSGHLPFEHDTLGQTIVAIATMAPPRLESHAPHVPMALADVIHRALEKDLDARWPDVPSFAHALEPFAAGVRFVAPPPSSVRPTASGEHSAEISLPPPPRVPSEAAALSRAETRPGSGADLELDVAVAQTVSASSASRRTGPAEAPRELQRVSAATPFVTTGERPAPAPAASARAPLFVGVALLLALVIGGGFALRGAGTSASGAPGTSAVETDAPASDVASEAPLAADVDAATLDAGVAAVEPPATEVPPSTVPSSVAAPSTDAHGHGPRRPRPSTSAAAIPASAASTTTPASSTTTVRGGRTGTLSRDDF
jgi:serine/threonine-protein kinase